MITIYKCESWIEISGLHFEVKRAILSSKIVRAKMGLTNKKHYNWFIIYCIVEIIIGIEIYFICAFNQFLSLS